MREIEAATTTPLESHAATNLAETLRQVDLNQGPKRSLEKPPGGTSCLADVGPSLPIDQNPSENRSLLAAARSAPTPGVTTPASFVLESSGDCGGSDDGEPHQL